MKTEHFTCKHNNKINKLGLASIALISSLFLCTTSYASSILIASNKSAVKSSFDDSIELQFVKKINTHRTKHKYVSDNSASTDDSESLDSDDINQSQDWPFYGADKSSTNSAQGQSDITAKAVKKRGFRIIWTLKTDPGFNGNNDDDVQPDVEPGYAKKPSYTPPAVIDNTLYFTTFGVKDQAPGEDEKLEEVTDIFVVDANTGLPKQGFPKSLSDYSADVSAYTGRNIRLQSARNTPTLYEGNLIFGTRLGGPTVAEYTDGQVSSVVMAIDASTGDFQWAVLVDNHPYARVTTSPMIHDGVIYVGTAIPDYGEVLDLFPFYKCCNSRASMLAIDASNGTVLWQTYTVPPAPGESDLVGPIGSENGIDLRRVNDPLLPPDPSLPSQDDSWYSGSSIWGGAPVIDTKRDLVIVGTGNNGSVPREARLCEKKRRFENDQMRDEPLGFPPLTLAEASELSVKLEEIRMNIGAQAVVCDAQPIILTDQASAAGKTVSLNDAFLLDVNSQDAKSFGNYPNSVVAFDRHTGDIKWVYRMRDYDAYTLACDIWITPISSLLCPAPFGVDADVSQPPILMTIQKGNVKHDIVLSANKGGTVIALNADDGTVFEQWGGERKLAQLGVVGGFQFGSSSDGKRYFVNASHSGNFDVGGLLINDPFGRVRSEHKVCHETVLDDKRIALGNPAERREVSSEHKIPRCKVVKNFDGSPGLTKTVGDYLSAVDIKTGNVLWQYADPSGDPELPFGNLSLKQGGTSVANNVVFSGNVEGVMRFHHAKTGEILREIDLNIVGDGVYANMIDSAPAIVGNRVYWGTGIGGVGIYNALNPFAGSDNVRMIALELCPKGTHVDPLDISRCVDDDSSDSSNSSH